MSVDVQCLHFIQSVTSAHIQGRAFLFSQASVETPEGVFLW